MSDLEHDPEGRDVTRASLDADLDLALQNRDTETSLRLRDEMRGRVISAACGYVARMLVSAWRLYAPRHFLT
jgi:hypothetical protein